MSTELILTNARILAGADLVRGTLQVKGAKICDLSGHATSVNGAQDLDGDYLIPGLVELHTDNLEKHFAPRPGVRWPALPAAIAHDAQVVAAGITTVFDAIALGDVMEGSTRVHNLMEMTDAVTEGCRRGLLRAEHFLHMRCELSYKNVLHLFEPFAEHPMVRLVSLMDHSPGQRQFASMQKYREYYQGKYGLDDTEIQRFIAQQIAASRRYSDAHRRAIVERCRARVLPLASHDDATENHIEEAAGYGMRIAEFPTTAEAARAARHRGMSVLMGAPNLVRGCSHSGNVSARDLAAEGLLKILSSDYFPASLLQAAFVMPDVVEGITLPEALGTVTRNPAAAAGLEDRGEIAPQRRGDLVRVRDSDGLPVVQEVWRGGHRVF